MKPVTENRRFAHYPALFCRTLFLVLCCHAVSVTVWAGNRITDMAGRTVDVHPPVERIITTFKPASLCMLSLGLENRLVGVDTPSKRDPLQKTVFPGIEKVTGVGSKSVGINFETLVALKPDLVVLYSQKDGIAAAERLETVGIPAVIIIPETFDGIRTTLEVISRAAGGPGKTNRVAEQMADVLAFLDQRLSELPESKKKTAYFASPRGIFSTATGNMLQDEIFEKAGLINVSGNLKGYFTDISPEQLIRWDPDILVLSQKIKDRQLSMLTRKGMGEISAVAGGNVFRCPSTLAPWDFPSPLSVLASLWLAGNAYPAEFERERVRQMIETYHLELFGRTLTEMGGELNDWVDLNR